MNKFSLKNLFKDTLVYGFGNVAKKFIGLLLLPFYTRALSPSDYGILDTLATLAFFISVILAVGLPGARSRYFFVAEGEQERGTLLFTSQIMMIVAFGIPLIVLIAFSKKISFVLFNTADLTAVVAITLATIGITMLLEAQEQVYRFYRATWKFNYLTLSKALLNPLSGITLVVLLKWGVLGATWASFISSFIILIFSFYFFSKSKYFLKFSWQWAGKLLRFGYPLIFTSILMWVNSVSDRFFILHYANLEEVGYYSIANTFAQPILLINLALSMSAFVYIYELYNEEKDEAKPNTKIFLKNLWQAYLSISISLSLLLSIFSYEIINFITTPQYISSILALPFLLFGHILLESAHITGNGMTIKEQSKQYAFISFIAAASNVALNFYFVPKLGFIGAAFTTLVSNGIYFIIAYYWSKQYFNVNLSLPIPLTYIIGTLLTCVFFTFSELKFQIKIPFMIKVPVALLSMTIPFMLKFVRLETITNSISKLREK